VGSMLILHSIRTGAMGKRALDRNGEGGGGGRNRDTITLLKLPLS
jgi:hypothetical protein